MDDSGASGVLTRVEDSGRSFDIAAGVPNAGSATAITAPTLPIFTYDQIAYQLTNSYWGGGSHRFDVASGGTLTVNLTALNAVGQLLAREALATWADIIGVHFSEVSSGGQIVFDDVDDGSNPHADAVHANGVTSSATVNVPRGWLVTYGTTLDSYSFQSYLHEIGHALGLGHAGDYNTQADYAVDASYQNDSWATTIMSYFSQTAATYFANQGFTRAFLGTPMNGDVIAATNLYGASTTTRSGNTVYGYNSTADRAVYDAAQFTGLAYTIFDSGGIDTLDYSLSPDTQSINLNAEQFSDVLGGVGNMVIARGVVIENATGGSGNDTITGNAVGNDLRGGGGDDLLDGGAGNDRLDGGAGNDSMSGGAGNDSYYVDSAADVIVEGSGQGTDTVFASVSINLRSNLEQLTLTGTGSINGRGNSLANLIVGNAGANLIDGGLGADTMRGGAGNDIYVVDQAGDVVTEASGGGTDQVRSAITYVLGADVENLMLTGSAAINGTGNALGNRLTGNAGANSLNGGTGADILQGGDGDDVYYADNAGDRAIETSAAGGTDTVRSSVTFALQGYVENLVLTGTAVRGIGSDIANRITGTSGANILDGRGGADTLNGGLGNDTYYFDDAGDVAVETSSSGGTDTVRSSVDILLGANLEILVLTGSATINGTGNALGNTLYGNAAANTLDGGAGADIMRGGGGNDTYIIDNSGDRAVESAYSGYDQVRSSVSFRLGANVESLVLTGTGAIAGTGNDLENQLWGNDGANSLNGGTGRDTMQGGLGDDTYYVDNAGDLVGESFGGGTDTVRSTVSHTLSDHVEVLILYGSAVSGTGNPQANRLYGNANANLLNGAAGADRMEGAAGDDTYFVDDIGDRVVEAAGGGNDTVHSSLLSYTLAANAETLVLDGSAANATGNGSANTLIGNIYNNVLDGGAGADTMIGGGSNDTYYVDNAGDVVVEEAVEIAQNTETDTVRSSVSYVLGTNVERLVLLGTGSINGAGNTLDNYIQGNDGNNVLDGGGGTDILQGYAGNDTYVIDSTSDVIWESSGNDTVRSSISYGLAEGLENLVLTGSSAIDGSGNSAANNIMGSAGYNTLVGGPGNDTINGAGGNDWIDGTTGNDVLTGGAGSDTFRISSPLTAQNVDVITDFAPEDLIVLWEGRFPLTAGALDPNAFRIGSGAADQYDRIIYESTSGNLYYDQDGTGAIAQVQIAQLSPNLTLAWSDFLVGG